VLKSDVLMHTSLPHLYMFEMLRCLSRNRDELLGGLERSYHHRKHDDLVRIANLEQRREADALA